MIGRNVADESMWKKLAGDLVPLSDREVVSAYKAWAPIYDWTFGFIARAGRNAAVDRVNRLGGRLLEVGVGTGLTLPRYSRRVEVVGMDLSPEMLEQARERVEREKLDNILGLSLMDASNMSFADGSFDVVTAMFVMTVAPDPEAVFAELNRVVRPGGEIIIVNHFSHDFGWRGRIEKLMAPYAARLGWRPEFPLEPFIDTPGLTLTGSREIAPLGLFTMLCFKKDHEGVPPDYAGARAEPVADSQRAVGGLVTALSGEGGS